MKRTLLLFASMVVLSALGAAQVPAAAAAPQKETPLQALPYTPGLDVDFMDRSVDPCVDFYTYSCGGWRQKNPIPPDQSSWSVYGKLTDENQRFLWGILEDAARPSASRNAIQQKIGDFFSSCMDVAAIEKAGAAPLEPGLRELAGVKDVSGLAPWVARQHLVTFGYSSMMFGFGSSQDLADSTQVIAFASAGGLGLPSDRVHGGRHRPALGQRRPDCAERHRDRRAQDRNELDHVHGVTLPSSAGCPAHRR